MISSLMTKIKNAPMKNSIDFFRYLLMPTCLKKIASYLFMPVIEKLKRQTKPISNINPVISNTWAVNGYILNASVPKFPRAKHICEITRARMNTTWRRLDRLMASKIFMVFSSWACSCSCTLSNRISCPKIVGYVIDEIIVIQKVTLAENGILKMNLEM